ncbi:Spermidine/putrescine import ATP-binding protein PotA [bioreactor metagenome]|uniref:Spermidine/putrescine import ATP-binding protein PotA n=1 Tax=bioreactor metagenome TaxID=1076179 RepID=A0A645H1A7_9ZZZZ
MRYELKRLQKSLKKTFIYITDDLDNAFALADKMAIFQHGTMHQFDTPRNIYETPETYFVASYIGNMNFFYARILNSIDGHYKVELDDHITVNITGYNTYDSDRNILYAIRPERMKLSNTPETENQNITKGKIIQKDYQAEYTQYYVQLEYGKIIVVAELNYNLLLNNALSNFFEVGESVYIKWSVLAGDLVYA